MKTFMLCLFMTVFCLTPTLWADDPPSSSNPSFTTTISNDTTVVTGPVLLATNARQSWTQQVEAALSTPATQTVTSPPPPRTSLYALKALAKADANGGEVLIEGANCLFQTYTDRSCIDVSVPSRLICYGPDGVELNPKDYEKRMSEAPEAIKNLAALQVKYASTCDPVDPTYGDS